MPSQVVVRTSAPGRVHKGWLTGLGGRGLSRGPGVGQAQAGVKSGDLIYSGAKNGVNFQSPHQAEVTNHLMGTNHFVAHLSSQ